MSNLRPLHRSLSEALRLAGTPRTSIFADSYVYGHRGENLGARGGDSGGGSRDGQPPSGALRSEGRMTRTIHDIKSFVDDIHYRIKRLCYVDPEGGPQWVELNAVAFTDVYHDLLGFDLLLRTHLNDREKARFERLLKADPPAKLKVRVPLEAMPKKPARLLKVHKSVLSGQRPAKKKRAGR